MKNFCLLSLAAIASLASTAAWSQEEPAAPAAGEQFNGSKPMACEAKQGHDCLPTEATCKPLKPHPSKEGKDMRLHLDVAKMTMRTPYRNDSLPIQSFSNNTKSLVLQGTSLEMVWSATVHRTTGRLTLVIADREGAYIVFGQCKLEGSPRGSQ